MGGIAPAFQGSAFFSSLLLPSFPGVPSSERGANGDGSSARSVAT